MPAGNKAIYEKCVSHYDCQTGYCKNGICSRSEAHSPCSTNDKNANCPLQFFCHPANQQCLPLGWKDKGFCKSSSECVWEYYCEKGRCVPRKSTGQSCKNNSECLWLNACDSDSKVCVLKCDNDSACANNESCSKELPGLVGVKVCQSNVFKPTRNHIPSPPPPPSPPSPPSPKPSSNNNNTIMITVAIASGAISLILLIILLVVCLRRKGAAPKVEERMPSLPTDSYYLTTPTSPASPQASTQYNTVISGEPISNLPSYQEALAEGIAQPTTTPSPLSFTEKSP